MSNTRQSIVWGALALGLVVGPGQATSPLGAAEGFAIFVINHYQASHTDCTGRVAVGRDAQFNHVGIGSALSNSAGTRDDLIVGDDLVWIHGQNFNGNTQVGDQTQLNQVGTPNGTIDSVVSIDFTAAQAELEALSAELATATVNGTVTTQWGQIFLSGTDPDINVFNLETFDFIPCYGFHVDAPAGSTVLVNVTGNAVMMNWFQPFLTGVTSDHILFNFPGCISLQMNGIGWKGSILAPTATMQFNNCQVDGVLIIGDLQGNGETHHVPFIGDLPVEDEDAFVVGSFD